MTQARPWNERFTGAYRTHNLVGRVQVLNKIQAVLEQATERPTIVLVAGDGGLGKTRLMDEVLRIAASMPTSKVAERIIDLYHVQNHTADGLANEIVDALGNPEEFHNFQRERRLLKTLQAQGIINEIVGQRERTLAAFTEDMQKLTRDQRVVLTLDTAERLVYALASNGEGDEMSDDQVAQSWLWLVNLLPKWQRVVLFVAGRHVARQLFRMLPPDLDWAQEVISLDPFSEEESLAYFAAVEEDARARGEIELTRRLQLIDDDLRRSVHQDAAGQPIMLALLVDYITVQGRTLPLPGDPPEAHGAGLLLGTHSLESELIRRLRETPRIGDTVLALGRTPKGADARLLAKLLEIGEEAARDRIDNVKQLSFVKIRPTDDRIFLHDEMYAILGRQVYDKPSDVPMATKVAHEIRSYYAEQQHELRRDLDSLFAPIEAAQQQRLDMNRLADIIRQQNEILAEDIYYRLRQNPAEGFKEYYRRSREAILSGDSTLDIQLQAEVLVFMAESTALSDAGAIDNLKLNVVRSMMLVRPVVRAWADQQYQKVLEESAQLRKSSFLTLVAPGNEANLNVWEAFALTYLGSREHLERAQSLLDQAIKLLESTVGVHYDVDIEANVTLWRASVVLGSAYRTLGYLHRVRGDMAGAVEAYRSAAALWRQVNMRAELAETLNNMGFAMSELGNWSDARALVNEALMLRRELGRRRTIGLSLNTLALIDIGEGRADTAVRLTVQALTLFRALLDQRSTGLALLALGDAIRRYTSSLISPQEKIDRLREAQDHTEEARNIFEGIGERSRQIEALINEGLILRDRASIRRAAPTVREDLERLVRGSAEKLRLAARLAEDTILYRRIDAMVNLAWLGFYADRDDIFDEGVSEVQRIFPEGYTINPETGKPVISSSEANIILWPQRGKLTILHGHRAFSRYRNLSQDKTAERQEALHEAVLNYTLGLEYNTFYSSDHRGLRLARDDIYNRLKDIDIVGLRQVANIIDNVEKTYHLKGTTLRSLLINRALWYHR